MNYKAIYKSFILTRNLNDLVYTEKHHIIPKSLGGSDSNENIIKLTAREHFFAHLLLAKIHGGKMWAALSYMSKASTKSAKNYKCTSHQYEIAKLKDSEYRSKKYKGENNPYYGKFHNNKVKEKMRKPRVNKKNLYGRYIEGTGDIISFVRTYVPFPVKIDPTVKNKIESMFLISNDLKKLNEFFRRSQATTNNAQKRNYKGINNPNYNNGEKVLGEKNPMFGKNHKNSTKAKIGEKAKRTLKCPHCDNISNIANAHRWHFENCKSKRTDTFTTSV